MSAASALCVGFGLAIRTQLPIPGAMAAAAGEEAAIEVEFGEPPAWAERLAWGPYRVADADLFDFTMDGVARFTCRDRRRITIAPAPGADEAVIAAMLVATALPALLWARGEIVIHAAALADPGAERGMLIAGPSGSGKSTWLQRAVTEGARVIADDAVRLRLVGGSVLASGLPGATFVRRGPGPDDRDLQAIPLAQQLREYPVDRLILLDADADAKKADQAGGPQILSALLRHRHRPRIAQLLRAEPDLLEPLARIATALRIAPIRR